MPNIGHTTIKATGSPQDLAALAAHVRGTARGSSAFTLSGLMHPDPAPDHAVCWAELSATDEMISLSIGLRRDLDSLAVATRLAKRFPALRIVASFMAECDEFAFDALGFAGGELAYKAHFDDDIRFPVSARGPGGRCASLVRCFRRTPARSAAAPDHMDAVDLGWLADRPVVAGEWRDATADGLRSTRVCWRPDAADGTGLALVARDGAFVLLTGMDCHGGYSRKKHLDAEGVVSRLPKLADQVGQHLREHAADQMACKPLQACAGDLQDFDVPFSEQASTDRIAAAAIPSTAAATVNREHLPGAAFMTALYRILRAIDDALFDHVFQPLLDRTGWNPARLAPLVLGASFAVLVARVLVLYGDGQLAEHILDAGVSLAASANLYRLYLARAARPGEPNVRRGHWIYLGLRLCMLTALHIQLLMIVAVAKLPVNLAFVLLAEALSIVGFYLGACEPPRPQRRRVPSLSPDLGTSASPRA